MFYYHSVDKRNPAPPFCRVLQPAVNNGMDKLPSLTGFTRRISERSINSGSKWWQPQEWTFDVGRNPRKIYKDDFNNLDFTQEESAFSYQTLSRCLQNLPKTHIKSTWKVSARDSGSSRFLKSELVSFCCEMYGLRCWKQRTLLMSCS